MRAFTLALFVVQAGATVQDSVDQMCKDTKILANSGDEFTQEELKATFANYAALMAPQLDCSEDPFNPEVGFDLKDVPFASCQVEKEKQLASNPQALMPLKCIEAVVDENAKTAAVWLEMGNSGKSSRVRAAVRFTFNADDKVTSFHCVYDSYNVLVTYKVQENVKQVCTLLEDMSQQKKFVMSSQKKMMENFQRWRSMLADKIDCSQDPFNPVYGFNLHGVAPETCQAKSMEIWQKTPAFARGGVASIKCIETFADEKMRTAAIWFEITSPTVHMRMAQRMHFDANYKVDAQHTVFDSYLMNHPVLSLMETSASWNLVSAAMACFGCVSLIGAFFIKRSQQKTYILLADDPIA